MMRNIFIYIVYIFYLCNLCFSAFSKDDAGTSTAQFLKLGAGARAAGMGDAFAGVSDDATAVYWNPAGIAQLEDKSMSLMHAFWFEDISYSWGSYVQPTEIGTFGLGIQYLSYGSIQEMDSTGLEGNDFKPSDFAATISCAKGISGIFVGMNAKYISSKIKEKAQAFAFDVGLLRRFLDDKLSIGLVGQNVGTKMKFVDEDERLPTNIKLGSAYNIEDNWCVALDVNAPVDNEINFCVGTEYKCKLDLRANYLQKENDVNIAIRTGYTTRTKDIDGLKGITVGFGGGVGGFQLDYAFVPFGNLGNTHRVSIAINFE